jgi:HK97 gp10 family phage protein
MAQEFLGSQEFDDSLKAVLRNLDALPANIERNIVRGALRASAKPILQAAQQNVPVKSGKLKQSVRISSSFDRRAGEVVISIKAGRNGSKGDPFYAHMVEFGTKPHKITGPRRIAGKWFRGTTLHPGTPASGFMRKAYDSTAQAVIDAYADYMRRRIDKEIAKRGGG